MIDDLIVVAVSNFVLIYKLIYPRVYQGSVLGTR